MNRLKAGFVDIVNPFNPNQARRIELLPAVVDCIVFWTRNPRPLFRYFDMIDDMGCRYYFLYTITGYQKVLEENLPSLKYSIDTFKRLSDRIGPARVIWRYDPIILSSVTDREFHERNFHSICKDLSGYTDRVIISFIDLYRKVKSRLQKLSEEKGINLLKPSPEIRLDVASSVNDIASGFNLKVRSCAEESSLSESGIGPGGCIDVDLINRLFCLDIPYKKDPHQRKRCLCNQSTDIGAYDTCCYRCVYCYANSSFKAALDNRRRLADIYESLYCGHDKL